MPRPPQCQIGLAISANGALGFREVWARAVRKYCLIKDAHEALQRNQKRARCDAAQKLLLSGTSAARSSEGETSPTSVVDGMPYWLASQPAGISLRNLSFGALVVVASASRRDLDRARNAAAAEDPPRKKKAEELPPHPSRRHSGSGSGRDQRYRPADASALPPVPPTLHKRKSEEVVSTALRLKRLSLLA